MRWDNKRTVRVGTVRRLRDLCYLLAVLFIIMIPIMLSVMYGITVDAEHSYQRYDSYAIVSDDFDEVNIYYENNNGYNTYLVRMIGIGVSSILILIGTKMFKITFWYVGPNRSIRSLIRSIRR